MSAHVHAHTFVLVSDDALLARTVQMALPAGARLQAVRSMLELRTMVKQERSLSGVIVDGALVDSDVTAHLHALRSAAPLVSVLFVAPQLTAALINTLQPLRVQLLVRPLPASGVASFIARACSAGRLDDDMLDTWVDCFAASVRLSKADRDFLPVVLDRETRAAACIRLGLDPEGLERGLRRLVKKCRVRNIDRLARNLMRDAYMNGSALTAELMEPLQAASF